MARNIEIKARLSDPLSTETRIEQLAGPVKETLHQTDTFFHSAQGRLKLREFGSETTAELIYYERGSSKGPKVSSYRIYRTTAPEQLKACLTAAAGARGTVRKTRKLFILDRTRIHLDVVEGLGWFLELEVVLTDEQKESEGEAIAQDLLTRLEIGRDSLVDVAYIDLLERS